MFNSRSLQLHDTFEHDLHFTKKLMDYQTVNEVYPLILVFYKHIKLLNPMG